MNRGDRSASVSICGEHPSIISAPASRTGYDPRAGRAVRRALSVPGGDLSGTARHAQQGLRWQIPCGPRKPSGSVPLKRHHWATTPGCVGRVSSRSPGGRCRAWCVRRRWYPGSHWWRRSAGLPSACVRRGHGSPRQAGNWAQPWSWCLRCRGVGRLLVGRAVPGRSRVRRGSGCDEVCW